MLIRFVSTRFLLGIFRKSFANTSKYRHSRYIRNPVRILSEDSFYLHIFEEEFCRGSKYRIVETQEMVPKRCLVPDITNLNVI